MKDEWTGHAVGAMHVYGVSACELAEKMGVHPKYLSALLNCKKRPKDAEFKVMSSLKAIIDEKTQSAQ